jgi:uncharacterized membrane protein
VALLYMVVVLGALAAVCSLAVDFGRVQLAKGELQLAADAAARHAATHLGDGVDEVVRAAVAAAADNTADGTRVALDGESDVEFGRWDKDAATFTVLTGAARADANACA